MSSFWDNLLDKKTGVLSNYCLELINGSSKVVNPKNESNKIIDLTSISEVVLEENISIFDSSEPHEIEKVIPINDVQQEENTAA